MYHSAPNPQAIIYYKSINNTLSIFKGVKSTDTIQNGIIIITIIRERLEPHQESGVCVQLSNQWVSGSNDNLLVPDTPRSGTAHSPPSSPAGSGSCRHHPHLNTTRAKTRILEQTLNSSVKKLK